jgi:diguanylate cyclase (GGDEF)-like protein/PAS domain S-box-containing protein
MPSAGAASRVRIAAFPAEDVEALRLVLDAIPHPIFIKDARHRFVVLNQAMCAFMGHAHATLAGKTDYDFIPKEHADEFRRVDRLVLKTGQVIENEELIPGRDGVMRTIVTRKKRATLKNGARLIIGSMSDVTELKQREASWRLLFEGNPVPMWVFDKESLRFLAVNKASVEHYGYSREQFLAMTLLDIRPEEDLERFRKFFGTPESLDQIWRHRKADGSLIDVLPYRQELQYEGRPAAMVAIIDVTQRERANRELKRTREFLNKIIEHVPVTIFVKDVQDLRYALINQAGEDLIGIKRNELIGRTDFELFPQEDATAYQKRDLNALRAGRQVVEEVAIRTSHRGQRDLLMKRLPMNGEDGKPRFLLGVAEDITERKLAAARIAHLANHDALTDLPNRPAFAERLDFTLERAAANRESFAVLCVDLDRFKDVNDVFGHSTGDMLLKEMARRLTAAAGGAFAARVGGDEFTLIQVDGAQPGAAVALADGLLETVASDFEIEGHTLRVGLSIGIAFFPNDGADAATLLSNADAALYRAKAAGRGVFRVFEPDMDKRLRERRILQQDLRVAVDRNELVLHYQPQALIGGEIVGFEALARWRHPERGMVSPGTFIPLAEESGLIIPIGAWILREACREAASWPKPMQVAVNLSPVQFRHGDLPAIVHGILLETGLPAPRLELEVTEGVLFEDFSRALSILRRLKALGVKIAMDDFGTGYSSLSYLQSFPFDKIKIDQSFVSMIKKDEQSAAIIRAIVGLGRGLAMNVAAEGVETTAQLDFLRAESCNEVQGYLVWRPSPIEHYAEAVGRAEIPAKPASKRSPSAAGRRASVRIG